MWKITKKEREIFFNEVIGDKDLLKTPLSYSSEKLTVEQLIKKDRISCDELDSLYKLLSDQVPIYKFVDSLEPLPITSTEIFDKNDQEKVNEEKRKKEEFRLKTERLKQCFENQQYLEMTRSIDPHQRYGNVNLMQDFGKELKQVNRQGIAIINTLITVGGAFVFGFFGLNMAYPHLQMEIATRMLLGLIFATIVFFADLYFIIKNMSLEEQVEEENIKKNM